MSYVRTKTGTPAPTQALNGRVRGRKTRRCTYHRSVTTTISEHNFASFGLLRQADGNASGEDNNGKTCESPSLQGGHRKRNKRPVPAARTIKKDKQRVRFIYSDMFAQSLHFSYGVSDSLKSKLCSEQGVVLCGFGKRPEKMFQSRPRALVNGPRGEECVSNPESGSCVLDKRTTMCNGGENLDRQENIKVKKKKSERKGKGIPMAGAGNKCRNGEFSGRWGR